MEHLVPRFIGEQWQAGRLQGEFEAATLFVDISGFTLITQALMRQGKVGAEILSAALNRVFAPIIEAVYEQGGFITNFAGDAFTAVFQQERIEAIEAALVAAGRIRRVVEDQEGLQRTPFGDYSLMVKQGLSWGRVEWGIVGPDGQKTYFFRGPAVEGCTVAEEQAQGGEIVLDGPVWAALETKGIEVAPLNERYARLIQEKEAGSRTRGLGDEGENLRGDWRLEIRGGEDKPGGRPGVSAFLPHVLQQGMPANEFRKVVVLFLSLAGELGVGELGAFVGQVMSRVAQFGGYFSEVDFGDKGCLLVAYFGAPVAHENDVERAVHCLLALQRETAGGPVRWRAGMTVGLVYAGLLGTAVRGKYTALGSMVNLAARLVMRAAWGEILVTERIGRQTNWQSCYLGDLALKGFERPTPTYQLLGSRVADEQAFEQAMVGRERELAQLLQAGEVIFDGRFAGVAAVYGEAGIGKSRLVYALAQALGERVTWLMAASDQTLRQPFNPFVHCLQRYFQQSPEATADENMARFAGQLEGLLERLAAAGGQEVLRQELIRTRSILGAFVGLHWPDSLYERLDARGRYENTLVAVKTLLLAESRLRPVVFVLEDGQWLDEASQELLTTLTRNVADHSLYIVVTARYGDDGSRPAWALAAGTPQVRLELGALAPPAVDALVETVLGGPPDDSLRWLLLEKAQANPFFAQQILYLFRENNWLAQQADGSWAVQAASFEVPDTINAILVARIDRLAQQVKEVVKVAAVVGREFEVRVLSEMLGQDTLPDIMAAERAQIWIALAELRYLFRHTLLRDAAYEMQLTTRLRELHRLAAVAFEQLYAADLSRHYGELAYHYGQAQMEGAERHYARLAGQQAAGQYANAEAIRFYSRALALTPAGDRDGRFELLLAREEMYGRQGARREQAADLAALTEVAAQMGDHLRQAQVALRRSTYAEDTSDYPAAIAAAAEAIALAEEEVTAGNGAAAGLAARGQVAWGTALVRIGDYLGAQEQLERALPIMRQLGDEMGLTLVLRPLGTLFWRQGQFKAAQEAWQEAKLLYQRQGDRQGEGNMINNLGLIHHEMNDLEQAKVHYQGALTIHQEVGSRRGQGIALNNLGLLSMDDGDYPQTRSYYDRSLAIRREVGDRLGEGNTLNNLGIVMRHLGQLQAALNYYEQALIIRREIGDQQGEGTTLINIGNACRDLGDYQMAEENLRRAVVIERNIGDPSGEALALNNLGWVLAGLGDVRQAEVCYRQAAEIQQTIGQMPFRMDSLAGLAHARWQLGDVNEALAFVNEILAYREENAALRGSESVFYIFRVCYEILAAEGDERAAGLLETAYGLLQEQAAKIGDEVLRRSFLANVPEHRALLALWRKVS